MDRKNFLAVLAFAVVLFLVNIWFEQQNEKNRIEQNIQQQALKSKKQKQLESDLAQRKAKASQLPLAQVFADNKGGRLIGEGVLSGDGILLLGGAAKLPEKVYVKTQANEAPEEASLSYQSGASTGPAIYKLSGNGTIQIADLPSYGQFDLQLIGMQPDGQDKPQILLGEYSDGNFEIIDETFDRLSRELEANPRELKQYPNAIALLKTNSGYIPTAIYDRDTRSLVNFEQFQGMSSFYTKPEVKKLAGQGLKTEEKFFVLENGYQQLVFSNYGGALAEINLPFKTKEDKKSAVREINYDREMVKDHPQNARFPAHPYSTFLNGELTEVKEGKLGGYYPLIRRDIIEKPPGKSPRVPPKFYGANLVSEYPEVAELVYEVKHMDSDSITFEAQQGHRRITKTFSIKGAPYCIELSVKIDGESRGLWITSGVPEVEWISGAPAPSLKYRITRNNKPEVDKIDLPSQELTMSSVYPDWVSNGNGFFGIILDPVSESEPGFKVEFVPGTTVPSRLVELASGNNSFKAKDMPGYQTLLPLKSTSAPLNFRLFAGPYSDHILKEADAFYSDPATGYNPDYVACQTFHGWFAFISEPFARFLNFLMQIFYQLTGSWGLSIILLTVALRVMLYPLNAWSSKSMIKMQKIGPEIQAIQEKYKKEPQKAQLEIMSLYRERGVNPVSGCFPMLIQLPFLIGMFDLLKSSFELRGASFIPGWINNLAAPDVVFSWKTPIFFIGNEFHLLPILLGVVMFIQQRYMTPAPADVKQMTDQQRQQRAMGNIMTIVFAIMFYNLPSGLNIYMLSSMLLGILQQWWTQKQLSKPSPEKNATIAKR